MIGGQGEDSCRKSGSNEEAHRPPAESKALQGNQQRCHNRSIRTHSPHCPSLDWRNLVMSQSHSLSVGADS
ncbi:MULTISPECIES: hypothetical protein [Priestia]|uniref:hypothetical protein n=1 Tax=Priestia TaxID=2800373 RepID=UPI0018A314EF|nr:MULTISPECIES: hypothetical protein [Priestia]QTL47740.1 hypothetical protein J5Z55_16800 [Priestia aryabhattai]